MEFIMKPWKHQLEVFEKYKDDAYIALFHEMGLGKTRLVIDLVRYKCYKHKRVMRTLIICPNIALDNWYREVGLHSRLQEETIILQGTKAQRIAKLDNPDKKLFIINFEGLAVIKDELLKHGFDIMIIDESQRCKNFKAVRSKIAIALSKQIPCRYILSGTPTLGNPIDIFTQYLILDRGKTFGDNFFSFRARYFEDTYASETLRLRIQADRELMLGNNSEASGLRARAKRREKTAFPVWEPRPDIMTILNEQINTIADVRYKKDCLDLPPKVYQTFDITLAKEQAKAYKEMKKELITYFQNNAVTAGIAVTKLIRLNQITSGFVKTEDGKEIQFESNPKLDAVKEILGDISSEHKVIIWAVFRNNIEMLEKELQEYNPVVVYGGMTRDQKTANQDIFNNDPKCRVFIANPQAAGLAINLIAADYTIRYSYNFNLEDWLQSEDRNHRGGSEIHEKITYIDLSAKGTIDIVILERLHQKEDIAKKLIKPLDYLL